jgi:6-pyruvoyltetrahydropterin/6-carboxytetrahydropterin synthase
MTATVSVRHNFETAHRLPHLPGKCQSLHGHSWWVDVTVAGDTDERGVLVEFAPFKQRLRQWIDGYLDHGVMLGERDPLRPLLPDFKTKVFTMAEWPTVENVAALLGKVANDVLCQLDVADKVRVLAVEVHETHVNRAGWRP